MNDISVIKERIKQKRQSFYSNIKKIKIDTNNSLYRVTSKLLLIMVIFLCVLIYTKHSPHNKMNVYNRIFSSNIPFINISKVYNQYLGGVLPFQNFFLDNRTVFKEKLVYKEANIYKEGAALTVDPNYLVPVQEDGIVVFIGNKEDYGSTVIIQQINGIDLWYANITNLNVKIFDYVEQGSFLGETIDDKLYLVYKKEGQVINYKDYLK
jgi:stage IV sporulation protein FA